MRSIDGRGYGSGNQARLMRALLAGTALSAFATLPAAAQNATWSANPGTSNYNLFTNWNPATVPGATGTATFGNSSITALTISADTTVARWIFGGTAAYTFAIAPAKTLTFDNAAPGPGAGINGGANVTITNDHILNFTGNTGSGGAKIITTNGSQTVFATGSNGFGSRFNTQAGGVFDISQITSLGFVVGSIEGAGDYFIGSKVFAVGSDNSTTTVDGKIRNGGLGGGIGGSLLKDGTGTLTLSGLNTYTGNTGILAGTLIVNGSIAFSDHTLVDTGGTLAGSGTVGRTTVAGGGIFAPGSGAPGTHMTVTGSLAILSGAIYLVQINPTLASSANAPDATLAGTVNAQFTPGSYVARNYTILSTTNGLGGSTFNALTTNNLPGGFTAHLSYLSDHDVILNLEAVLGVALASRSIATSGARPPRSTPSSTMAARCRRVLPRCSGLPAPPPLTR
jgi:autotransporter-associated beta strand protein